VDNDPATLADAMLKISTMPLQEMGQRGRAWMQEESSWASVSKDMLALYGKCLHQPNADNDVRDYEAQQFL
jgi:glycosyltransferase involved in cell wall biosynthesis